MRPLRRKVDDTIRHERLSEKYGEARREREGNPNPKEAQRSPTLIRISHSDIITPCEGPASKTSASDACLKSDHC